MVNQTKDTTNPKTHIETNANNRDRMANQEMIMIRYTSVQEEASVVILEEEAGKAEATTSKTCYKSRCYEFRYIYEFCGHSDHNKQIVKQSNWPINNLAAVFVQ